LEAQAQLGLTNRVFRIRAELGTFYLRVPHPEAAGSIDRRAEAHNLDLAVACGLALPPVYCDAASGVLVTRAVTVLDPSPADLPRQLGQALGRLHVSGSGFQGRLDPNEVFQAQRERLPKSGANATEQEELFRAIEGLEARTGAAEFGPLVPSHGDPSPGNCLAVSEHLWLIDWEYSAMAVPAWDIAYAILEHGFAETAERLFLESYCATTAGALCPSEPHLELMKAKCDAISALWAFEQVAAGRDKPLFLTFARARRDRVLSRLKELVGKIS